MRTPICGAGVARVSEVRRDVKSGHIMPRSAYEGWRPTDRPAFRIPAPSGLVLAALCSLGLWLAFALVVRICLDIPG